MSKQGDKRTVLVVDDTPSTISVVRAALEGQGYWVVEAQSGEKALSLAESTMPDLILLDILMPGMGGYETCMQLKARDVTKDIPVIFMFAHADEFKKIKGLELGAVDYVSKPIETQELIRRVDTHLTIGELRKELRDTETTLKEHVSALDKSTWGLSIRDRISRILLTVPDEDMYGEVLDVILEAMESKYGVFGYVDENGALVCPSMTKDIWEWCQVQEKTLSFPREKWGGIWGTALVKRKTLCVNEPMPVPEGHVPISRALAVPIAHRGEVVGQLTVANKESDFDESDKRLLESISAHIAPVLYARLQNEREERDRKKAEENLRQRSRELSERVKELNCLYGVSDLCERSDIALGEFVQGVVDLIPPAWQYPEITCARVVLEGKEFRTTNFRKSVSRQMSPIKAFGRRVGTVEVRYLEERPESDEGPFLHEERNLINAIAQRLGRFVERKRAETAIRESEERFRAVFEGAQDCIFVKDNALSYTHVNAAMCKLLGLPASKIIGRKAEDLFGEEIGKQVTEGHVRVLAGESIEVEQTRLINGVPVTFHDNVVPLRNSVGRIVGVCGISRNITERKKLRADLPIDVADYPSQSMRVTLEKAGIAADADGIVLLEGESGSGKDYLARWIHDHSQRVSGPFFSINCAALPRELAESELFGHERGSFTGATGMKRGMLELAEGGTILLNEIGELDLSLQSKLLAFLDTRSFLRVGGQKYVNVNARLIAASHRDLNREVSEGRFLRPLFYRLSVFPIHVPALRERIEDIPTLVRNLLAKLAVEMQLSEIPLIEPADIEVLSRYDWPGNVRELRNVLERSLMLSRGTDFSVALPAPTGQPPRNGKHWSHTVTLGEDRSLPQVTDEVIRSLCTEVLSRCGGRKKEAARLLGISRGALYRYLKRLGIEHGNGTRA